MQVEQIVPDVLDELPKETLEVSIERFIAWIVNCFPLFCTELKVKYSPELQVNNGNILTPAQVKDAPSTISWPAQDGSLYTLLMVDPDAPSRRIPFLREINHWLVVNIKGNDISSGNTILPYRGSGPPILTGLHRYIFLIFKQESRLPIPLDVNRWGFKTRKFIETHKLGHPIAGNFFQSQFTRR